MSFAACSDRASTQGKVYTSVKYKTMIKSAHLCSVKRITVLSCIHAKRDLGRSMFVLQWTPLCYRRTRARERHTGNLQVINNCLPQNALVLVREEVEAVHSSIFQRYAEFFVKDTEHLRKDYRKILLLYDGYRSYMNISAVETFADTGMIAYELPAHTNSTAQLLNCSVFASLKAHFRQLVDRICRTNTRSTTVLD